jgi:helix-turn-helix protein
VSPNDFFHYLFSPAVVVGCIGLLLKYLVGDKLSTIQKSLDKAEERHEKAEQRLSDHETRITVLEDRGSGPNGALRRAV